MRRFFAPALALAFGLAFTAASADASCPIVYRIWQDGENYYFQFGETIYLERGATAHLYIHSASRSPTPYSTAADIGAPSDYGVGGQRTQDIQKVLRLGKHDRRKGWQEMQAVRAGQTALAYSIWEVVRPGRLDQIPARCRVGQVKITVVD